MTLIFFILWQFCALSVASEIFPCSSNDKCGCSVHPAVVTKIIGGEAAGIDTWGWAVSIRVWNHHICGGSLISSSLVVTAAHCLFSLATKSSLTVTAGSKYLSIIHQRRSIENIYIHRDYDSFYFLNDIAILELSSPFDSSDRSITFICLPNSTAFPSAGAIEQVVAIGWGVLEADQKTSSDLLQQVALLTVPSSASSCQNSIYNVKRQFCAGVEGGGKDTCQGDSGGPLMYFSGGQWQLVGITSYGTGCALADYAGVYTRVSTYLPGIVCFLQKNQTCMETMFVIKTSFSSRTSSISDCNRFCLALFCLLLCLSRDIIENL